MATITERLKWLIEADASSAIKGFEATGLAAETNLKKAQTHSQKTGDQLTKVGAGAIAVSAIVGTALIKAAGSFEDLALKAGQMSDATGLSVDQASRWIEVSGDMGIGADTIESALGKMNKTLGNSPEKFDELGIHIATTKTGVEDVNGTFLNTIDRLNQIEDPAARAAAAAGIFGKGWQGSAELLKLSTDDIKTQLQSVSDQKVINEGELQKAKDYRHDLDTLKDSAESLALAIGQGAAPAIGAIASAVGTAVQAFADLDGISHGAAGGILAAGAAALGIVGAMSVIAGQALKVKDRFTDASGAMTTFGKTAVLGAGIAAGAMLAYTLDAQDSAQATADLKAQIEELSRVSDADLLKTFVDTIVKGYFAEKDLKQTTDELAQSNLEGAQRVRDMIHAHIEAGTASQNEKDTIVQLNQSINDEIEARKQGKKTTGEYKDTTDDATAAADRNTLATNAVKAAVEGVTAVTDSYKEHAKQMAADVKRGLDEISGRWDALTGNINDDKTFANLQTGFDELKVKVTDAWDAASSGADDAEQKTRDAKVAIDDQKLAVIDYAKEVLKLPVEQTTKIVALVDQGKLDEAEALLVALTRNRTVSLDIVAKGGAGYSKLPNFDSGGTVPGPRGAPTLAVVHGGEQVLTPGQQSSNGDGGGSTTNNITIMMPVGSDGNDVVNAIRTFERRNGAGWRS